MTLLPMPTRVDRADDLLEPARRLIDTAADAAVASDVGISCRAGCTACCHHAVPVSPAEIRSVLDAVAALPAERREQIGERSASARARLEAEGFAEGSVTGDVGRVEREAAARRYFDLAVPCPLLTDGGVCSVRDARPLACREYLVVSDPVHCDDPRPETVARVRLRPGTLSAYRAASAEFGEPSVRVLALALTEPAPEAPPAEPRSGPRLGRMLLSS